MLVGAGVAIVLVCDALRLLNLRDGVRDVYLVLFEVELQVAIHGQLQMHTLLL